MPDEIAVSEVRVRFNQTKAGSLVAWASCVVNRALRIDSIEIRRGGEGRLYIECPSLPSRRGVRHPVFCPISRRAREALERAIIGELERTQGTNGGRT